MEEKYTPIETAVALSLYAYNVSPLARAKKLYDHFDGNCMEIVDFLDLFTRNRAAYIATELPMPTAIIYVEHALERYGTEAKAQVDGTIWETKRNK